MSEMKLTRDEAIRLHRELWDWLTRNPDKKKMDWPRWKNFGSMNGYCFFCEWALYQGGTTSLRRSILPQLSCCFYA